MQRFHTLSHDVPVWWIHSLPSFTLEVPPDLGSYSLH